MRLRAFQIENFRSIVDTGMQTISPDNITCLIGQNESGKTSILEALAVFSSGVIYEDVLRSDLSLPRVTCSFEIPENYLESKLRSVNDDFDKIVKSLNHITLIRSWKADLESQIGIGGELLEYIEKLDKDRRKELIDVKEKIKKFYSELNDKRGKKKSLTAELVDIKEKLDEHPTRRSGLKLFRKRTAEVQDDNENTLRELNEAFEKARSEIDKINSFLI